MNKNYTFNKDYNTLECFTYAVKKSEQKEDKELKRLIGNDDEDDEGDLIGEPKKVTLDFDKLENIMYFHEAEADLFEKGNETKVTFVEFGVGLNFLLLIPYKEFNTLYFDYMTPPDVVIKESFFKRFLNLFK